MPIVPWLALAEPQQGDPAGVQVPTDTVIRRFLHQLVFDGMKGHSLPVTDFSEYTDRWDNRLDCALILNLL